MLFVGGGDGGVDMRWGGLIGVELVSFGFVGEGGCGRGFEGVSKEEERWGELMVSSGVCVVLGRSVSSFAGDSPAEKLEL